ncbi:MAG: primosomal protein N', partial [Nitrospiraceae bacterium]
MEQIPGDPTWTRLEKALSASQAQTVLLTAPPRARWTAVLRATEATLSRHRTVLLVFPELARAAAVAGMLNPRWGNRIAFLHGELSVAARAQAWDQVRAGSAEVVVGTRSAIFAPIQGLGLIYIDDEEDPLLKEEREPHYHARDVGKLRAQLEQAMLVLGSSHPSLDTLATLEPELLVQPSDFRARAASWVTDAKSTPVIEPVDLRGLPYRTQLSEPMIDGIQAALRARSGSVLFLNRRGFATALICRDCGAAPRCNRCDVSLTLHRQTRQLLCHYCGVARTPSDTCPSCQAIRLEPVGFGTERIEEELRDLFPNARVGRLDRDAAGRPGQADAIRRQLSAGGLDILIGTQMLFQGSPLPKVGFVGLPLADAGLHLPDFRAAERTYHVLLDAVGLARPTEEGGHVVLQTFLPTHHAIAAVISRTPGIFYADELAFRKALG